MGGWGNSCVVSAGVGGFGHQLCLCPGWLGGPSVVFVSSVRVGGLTVESYGLEAIKCNL